MCGNNKNNDDQLPVINIIYLNASVIFKKIIIL